jgi:integrase
MLGTGVRIGEALAVRWCDVDLEGVPVADGDTLRAVSGSNSTSGPTTGPERTKPHAGGRRGPVDVGDAGPPRYFKPLGRAA